MNIERLFENAAYWSKDFLCFWKKTHAYKTAFIWSNKNSNIMKYHCYLKKRFSILIFKTLFNPVMAKLDFQQPLLKCHMIHHKSF